jgi:hypothetical protein
MDSPLGHFIAWYESLPPDQRLDTAYLVSFCPGFGLDVSELGPQGVTEPFVRLVRSYKDGGLREKAAALALRSYIQMVIIDKRSSRQDWAETQATLGALAEKHNSETFRTQAAEIRLRGEQWIVSCEKWTKLVAGPMSDDAIRALFP